MRNYAKTLHKVFKQHVLMYLLESPQGFLNIYMRDTDEA